MQVATTVDETGDSGMVVKRLSVPMGLEELMESLTKQVLIKKPKDFFTFAFEHFAHLVAIRDELNMEDKKLQSSEENAKSAIKVKTATMASKFQKLPTPIIFTNSKRTNTPLKSTQSRHAMKSTKQPQVLPKTLEKSRTVKSSASSDSSSYRESKRTTASNQSNKTQSVRSQTKKTSSSGSQSTTKSKVDLFATRRTLKEKALKSLEDSKSSLPKRGELTKETHKDSDNETSSISVQGRTISTSKRNKSKDKSEMVKAVKSLSKISTSQDGDSSLTSGKDSDKVEEDTTIASDAFLPTDKDFVLTKTDSLVSGESLELDSNRNEDFQSVDEKLETIKEELKAYPENLVASESSSNEKREAKEEKFQKLDETNEVEHEIINLQKDITDLELEEKTIKKTTEEVAKPLIKSNLEVDVVNQHKEMTDLNLNVEADDTTDSIAQVKLTQPLKESSEIEEDDSKLTPTEEKTYKVSSNNKTTVKGQVVTQKDEEIGKEVQIKTTKIKKENSYEENASTKETAFSTSKIEEEEKKENGSKTKSPITDVKKEDGQTNHKEIDETVKEILVTATKEDEEVKNVLVADKENFEKCNLGNDFVSEGLLQPSEPKIEEATELASSTVDQNAETIENNQISETVPEEKLPEVVDHVSNKEMNKAEPEINLSQTEEEKLLRKSEDDIDSKIMDESTKSIQESKPEDLSHETENKIQMKQNKDVESTDDVERPALEVKIKSSAELEMENDIIQNKDTMQEIINAETKEKTDKSTQESEIDFENKQVDATQNNEFATIEISTQEETSPKTKEQTNDFLTNESFLPNQGQSNDSKDDKSSNEFININKEFLSNELLHYVTENLSKNSNSKDSEISKIDSAVKKTKNVRQQMGLEEDKELFDVNIARAVCTIQAFFRGYLIRKKIKLTKLQNGTDFQIQNNKEPIDRSEVIEGLEDNIEVPTKEPLNLEIEATEEDSQETIRKKRSIQEHDSKEEPQRRSEEIKNNEQLIDENKEQKVADVPQVKDSNTVKVAENTEDEDQKMKNILNNQKFNLQKSEATPEENNLQQNITRRRSSNLIAITWDFVLSEKENYDSGKEENQAVNNDEEVLPNKIYKPSEDSTEKESAVSNLIKETNMLLNLTVKDDDVSKENEKLQKSDRDIKSGTITRTVTPVVQLENLPVVEDTLKFEEKNDLKEIEPHKANDTEPSTEAKDRDIILKGSQTEIPKEKKVLIKNESELQVMQDNVSIRDGNKDLFLKTDKETLNEKDQKLNDEKFTSVDFKEVQDESTNENNTISKDDTYLLDNSNEQITKMNSQNFSKETTQYTRDLENELEDQKSVNNLKDQVISARTQIKDVFNDTKKKTVGNAEVKLEGQNRKKENKDSAEKKLVTETFLKNEKHSSSEINDSIIIANAETDQVKENKAGIEDEKGTSVETLEKMQDEKISEAESVANYTQKLSQTAEITNDNKAEEIVTNEEINEGMSKSLEENDDNKQEKKLIINEATETFLKNEKNINNEIITETNTSSSGINDSKIIRNVETVQPEENEAGIEEKKVTSLKTLEKIQDQKISEAENFASDTHELLQTAEITNDNKAEEIATNEEINEGISKSLEGNGHNKQEKKLMRNEATETFLKNERNINNEIITKTNNSSSGINDSIRITNAETDHQKENEAGIEDEKVTSEAESIANDTQELLQTAEITNKQDQNISSDILATKINEINGNNIDDSKNESEIVNQSNFSGNSELINITKESKNTLTKREVKATISVNNEINSKDEEELKSKLINSAESKSDVVLEVDTKSNDNQSEDINDLNAENKKLLNILKNQKFDLEKESTKEDNASSDNTETKGSSKLFTIQTEMKLDNQNMNEDPSESETLDTKSEERNKSEIVATELGKNLKEDETEHINSDEISATNALDYVDFSKDLNEDETYQSLDTLKAETENVTTDNSETDKTVTNSKADTEIIETKEENKKSKEIPSNDLNVTEPKEEETNENIIKNDATDTYETDKEATIIESNNETNNKNADSNENKPDILIINDNYDEDYDSLLEDEEGDPDHEHSKKLINEIKHELNTIKTIIEEGQEPEKHSVSNKLDIKIDDDLSKNEEKTKPTNDSSTSLDSDVTVVLSDDVPRNKIEKNQLDNEGNDEASKELKIYIKDEKSSSEVATTPLLMKESEEPKGDDDLSKNEQKTKPTNDSSNSLDSDVTVVLTEDFSRNKIADNQLDNEGNDEASKELKRYIKDEKSSSEVVTTALLMEESEEAKGKIEKEEHQEDIKTSEGIKNALDNTKEALLTKEENANEEIIKTTESFETKDDEDTIVIHALNMDEPNNNNNINEFHQNNVKLLTNVVRAAIKIQSMFRSFRVRTRRDKESAMNRKNEQKETKNPEENEQKTVKNTENIKEIIYTEEETQKPTETSEKKTNPTLGQFLKSLSEPLPEKIPKENVNDEKKQESFYLHSPNSLKDNPISDAIKLTSKLTNQKATIGLLHSGEFHDSVPYSYQINQTESSSSPKKDLPDGHTVEKESRPKLVHTSEFHDTAFNVSDKEAPAGVTGVTSTRYVAHALLTDDSKHLAGSTGKSGSVSVMEGKRNNATIQENNNDSTMEAQAATKIQASFRGYQVRKQLKSKNGGDIVTPSKRSNRRKTSSSNMPDSKKIKEDDLEEKSATKIQAGIRGFLVRRRHQKKI